MRYRNHQQVFGFPSSHASSSSQVSQRMQDVLKRRKLVCVCVESFTLHRCLLVRSVLLYRLAINARAAEHIYPANCCPIS